MSHTLPIRRGRLAVLVSALLYSAGSLAQTASAQDPVELDTVRVNAYRVTTHTSGATKTDTPIAETAKSVSVIAREELDARGAVNLNEAMRYVAGVMLEPYGTDNRTDSIRIRGFDVGLESSNYVTLDGLRTPISSGWNWAKIDTWNLDRVEVLKGPAAVMYGQVAPGGLVNQVSKTPEPGQPQVLQIGVDGYGTWSTAFDAGAGSGDDRHLFRLVGRYADGDTQIDTVEQKHWFLAPSYTFQIADKTRLTLLGVYQQDEGGATYQFLPMDGTLLRTPNGYLKNSTFLGEENWNTYDRTVWTAGWLFEHSFNENWTLSQGARRMHVDSLYRGVVTNGGLSTADYSTQARRAVDGTGDADGTTVDTRITGKFATGALEHTLLIGADWQKSETDNARGGYTAPASIDIWDRQRANWQSTSVPYVPTLVSVGYSGAESQQAGFYLQDQMSLGNWRFTVGGRYDETEDESWSRSYAAATGVYGPRTASKIENDAFTANAGVLYASDSGFSPYVSYAESFQPSGSDTSMSYDGSAFDPVTGKQFEAGVKYQPSGFDGLFTLAAYDLRQKDILINDADPTHNTCGSTGTSQCRVQDGQTRVRGVELEARITPLQGFSVIGAASRMDSEYVRNSVAFYEGKPVAQTPDWIGSLWGDYTFQSGALEGFSIATGLRYYGDSYSYGTDRGGVIAQYEIPAYTLWDAALRLDLSRVSQTPLLLSLNLGNIADKRFVSTCTGPASCWYGTGRTIAATARWTW